MMVNTEKKTILHELIFCKTSRVEFYYKALREIGDEMPDYDYYMNSSPINCDEELARLPNADYGLCCTLLTMLLREDHFCNGSFEERYRNGQLEQILERMVNLLD